MSEQAPPAETLGRIVARRIVVFALIAMAAQSGWMLWRYLCDPDHMADHLVDLEIDALAQGLRVRGGQVTFEPPRDVADRYAGPSTGYVGRVRGADGSVLWRSCDEACVAKAFPVEMPPSAAWMRRTRPDYPLVAAGGRQAQTTAGTAFIETSIDGDPRGMIRQVIAAELVEEMLLPTGIALAFAVMASLYSISRSLAPVKTAARIARRLDPLKPDTRIDPAGMPLEISRFVEAVNRSYARVRELTSVQRTFTVAISHEIRTPLAALRLELEGIDHPRARRATEALDDLVAFVEQLTALARIEAVGRAAAEPVDLTAALREMVAGVAPWVFDQGAAIAFEEDGAATVRGDGRLIRNAARNLVENAVRHGGAGVTVCVRAGPGASFSVEDDGPEVGEPGRLDDARTLGSADGLGIGLKIVRRIAALHDARFEIARRRPRGVAARMVFGEAETVS